MSWSLYLLYTLHEIHFTQKNTFRHSHSFMNITFFYLLFLSTFIISFSFSLSCIHMTCTYLLCLMSYPLLFMSVNFFWNNTYSSRCVAKWQWGVWSKITPISYNVLQIVVLNSSLDDCVQAKKLTPNGLNGGWTEQ